MPKFQVGDIVSPTQDYPAKNLYKSKTYVVEAVGITCDQKDPFRNVKLQGISGTTPHENNLSLVQRAAPTLSTSMSMFQPGDLVEAREGYAGVFTLGGVYKVTQVDPGSPFNFIHVEFDDKGVPNCWTADKFNLWSSQGRIGGSPVAQSDPLELSFEPEPEPLSPEQARKERIWAALKGAAKQ